MSLLLVVVLGIAILLIYSAVKDKSPIDVVKQALGGA